MNIKKYNKLVRDQIPEIINGEGKTCIVETLNQAEYLIMLEAKLGEELNEYYMEHSIEELADLLEVIYATVKASGYTKEDLERIRLKKAKSRGAFEKRLLLKEVIDSK